MNLDDDPSELGLDELTLAFVENVRDWHAIDHMGRQNRLLDRRELILYALRDRGEGTLRPLLPLLTHPQAIVRAAAAVYCRKSDERAALAVLEALAAGEDEAAAAARTALERSRGSDPYRRYTSPPWENYVHPKSIFWWREAQAPTGLSALELKLKVHAVFPPDRALKVLDLMRPAIRLWPEALAEADPRAATTRFGGRPLVPEGWTWPRYLGEPLLFLAQIDCRDLVRLPAASPLPDRGVLAFFADHDATVAAGVRDQRQGAVHYWPETEALVPMEPPPGYYPPLPAASVRFIETVGLPHPLSAAVERLGLTGDEHDQYVELHEAASANGMRLFDYFEIDVTKLLGWPDLLYEEPAELKPPHAAEGWRLLFQIGGYSNGRRVHFWGPGGLIYFMIRDEDLALGRFERARLAMQGC